MNAQEAHEQSVDQYLKWLRLMEGVVLDAVGRGEFSVSVGPITTDAAIALETWFTDQGHMVTTEHESIIAARSTKCIISWAEK